MSDTLADMSQMDPSKRTWLIATGCAGTVGGVAPAIPFISTFQPSERAKAAGAPVEVDISKIEPGMLLTVEWRGKPVWIVKTRPGAGLPEAGDAGMPLLNPLDQSGRPRSYPAAGARAVRVQVPADSSTLQSGGEDLPRLWRMAVRQALGPLLTAGYHVSRFVRAHEGQLPYYVVSRGA